MKSFNITSQSPFQKQAIIKEYLESLSLEIDSLYQYLHYYNPEWRVLKEGEKSYIIDNEGEIEEITESKIVDNDNNTLKINKLDFRWGFQNRTSHKIKYGNQMLNIGATIFKKDSYDLGIKDYETGVKYSKSDYLYYDGNFYIVNADITADNNTQFSDLNTSTLDVNADPHFVVFESALAQYYNWTFSADNGCIIYHFFADNESSYGLSFPVQIAKCVPRYYYANNFDTDYEIRYNNSGYNRTGMYDYSNYNVSLGETSTDTTQSWQGASAIIGEVMYKDENDNYEDLISDAKTYQRRGQNSEYLVFLDRYESSFENNFFVFFH